MIDKRANGLLLKFTRKDVKDFDFDSIVNSYIIQPHPNSEACTGIGSESHFFDGLVEVLSLDVGKLKLELGRRAGAIGAL